MGALRRLLAPVRNRATVAACVVVACFAVAAAALFLDLLRQSLVDILDDAVAELAEDVPPRWSRTSCPPCSSPTTTTASSRWSTTPAG